MQAHDKKGGGGGQRTSVIAGQTASIQVAEGQKDASSHIWAEKFSIIDKRAGNSTITYEWWPAQKVTDELLSEGKSEKLAVGEADASKASIALIQKQLEEHGID